MEAQRGIEQFALIRQNRFIPRAGFGNFPRRDGVHIITRRVVIQRLRDKGPVGGHLIHDGIKKRPCRRQRRRGQQHNSGFH